MTVREILTYINDLTGICIFDSRKNEKGGQKEIGRYESKNNLPEWIKDSTLTLIDVGFDSDLWLNIIVGDNYDET